MAGLPAIGCASIDGARRGGAVRLKKKTGDLESLVAEHDSVPSGIKIANGASRAADERRRPISGVCVNHGRLFEHHITEVLEASRWALPH
jgi:hypothetical protein